MKQQLSIFLVFLILINCSTAMNIKNNILLSNHLVNANKAVNSAKANNFIDTKMLETCDEGILADIDPTNIFYNKISFPSKYIAVSPTNNGIFQLIPQFNTPINIGENGKSMSRLTIRLVIPGLRITINNNSHHTYCCKLFLDSLEIAGYFFQQNVTYGDSMEDMVISGTLFNIPPGLYIVSLQCYNYYGVLVFGQSEVNHNYMEFFGEYSAGADASTITNNFLLPVTPKTISRKKTKFIFAVDDILTWIQVNGSSVRMFNYATDAEVDQCCNSKAFPILVAEGDTIQFRGSDRGSGLRGMRVSINYYNNLGYPEIYNSDYNTYSMDNLTDPSRSQENMSTYSPKIDSLNSYLPVDYSANWIWNAGAGQSFVVATAVLPSKNTNSVMFIQACTHLVEVKVNAEVARINTANADKCERVQQLKSPTDMSVLKSGDKISIKMKKSPNSVGNKAIKAYIATPYITGFVAAVIAYKNKLGEIVEIRTGQKGWTCNGKTPKKVPIQDIYRNDFYLTSAFEARAIYDDADSEYTCDITLP